MSKDYEASKTKTNVFLHETSPMSDVETVCKANTRKRVVHWLPNMFLSIGMLLVLWLFSTGFTLAPTQAKTSNTPRQPVSHQAAIPFGWSGWSQVPGGGATTDAPTTVRYRASLYVF